MSESHRDREILEVSGAVLGLAIVLLPACGFVMRLAAFTPLELNGGQQMPFILAWAAPLPTLLVDGAFSSLFAVAILVVFFLGNFFLTSQKLDAFRSGKPTRSRFLIAVGVTVGAVVLLIWNSIFSAGFPWVLFSVPYGVIGWWAGRNAAAEKRRLRFADIWWTLGSLLLVGAAVLGLYGILGSTPGDYRFTNDAHPVAADGRYDQLGQANGFTYLVQCTTKQLVVVGDSEILTVVPVLSTKPPPSPSLYEVLTLHRAIRTGYHLC